MSGTEVNLRYVLVMSSNVFLFSIYCHEVVGLQICRK